MKNKYKKKKETHLLLDKTCQINAKKKCLWHLMKISFIYTQNKIIEWNII